MRGPIKRLNSITKETEARILRVMKIVIAVIFVVGLVAVIVAGVVTDGQNTESNLPQKKLNMLSIIYQSNT